MASANQPAEPAPTLTRTVRPCLGPEWTTTPTWLRCTRLLPVDHPHGRCDDCRALVPPGRDDHYEQLRPRKDSRRSSRRH